ncbi:hypothetical protein GCM10027290_55330 [Micromonospora sonneratiae]|uniref:Uncharacterized protein n=1 Tax=Micromonospora sonneratiae TaxID=1184706 RepID=A0ABW3YAV9_9ACTN
MTHNSSPYWERERRENMRPESTGQSAPSEPYAELFAVLDRADVSEAVRAACAHALNPPPTPIEPVDPADYADVLVDRMLAGREQGPRVLTSNNDPRNRYTLHLTFPAANLPAARSRAAAYAGALGALRPELGFYPAVLSRADEWNHVEPVTCGTIGPENETCARTTDHLGCHRDSAGGLCWGDDDSAGDLPGDKCRHGDTTGRR